MARQSGFTIIEVLLFLAVSGMLFVIAAASLNATIRSTRFTDATNGLENFISQQYSDVRSGVSYRVDGVQTCAVGGGGVAQAPGASDGCIVVGRLLDFVVANGPNTDAIRTYTIVANRCPQVALPTENGCPGAVGGPCTAAETSDAAKIATYCPRVLWGNPLETYIIPWGVSLPATVGGSQNPRVARLDGTQPRFNRIAIIHSPTSERVYTYAYDQATVFTNTQVIDRNFLVRNTADRNTMACLENPGVGAVSYQYVSIGAGQSSDLITSGAARAAAQMPGGLVCS